ncbi:TIGR03571 family LLM class oxidoreductase [Shinella daejeonensis]|uniref:TIGR03571 family LLM class oxidoreductase n=1 Tax=Shinella daejeonensis TaxID=659017 RepID=UPI0020C76146|nr:TIGR03571 family LLM class oxidoreductase [Shinella daejeonensis]MCP8894604.1 TIGR03571 family LLM class oxidoreductase [Shinella daejeonensis]
MPHRSESRANLFREGRMSVGLVLPIRTTDAEDIDFRQQVELAALAEQLGFAAVWVRDVPLNGPWYPEAFGHPDPFVMLGTIAAATSHITIGTAATVLTLRHPLHIAKAAISLDRLAPGRFVLGLGSGDRREEFAAFGENSDNRKDLHRAHWAELAAALERPSRIVRASPDPVIAFELRPSAQSLIPMLAVGSGGQSLDWIARNAPGWVTYHRPPRIQQGRHGLWRTAVERSAGGRFRSFSVALRIELVDDPAAPAEGIDIGYRLGARELIDVLGSMRDAGTHHALLNIVPNGMPARENLEIIARDVLPALG